MNVDDLLDPLRYQNLREFTAANLEAIGGGVFTERDTLEHLRMLDLIAKAYQSVHLPTHGQPIPSSTNTVTSVQSTDEATLLTAKNNETLQILSISCPSETEDSLTQGFLQIYNLNSLTTTAFMDIPGIDTLIGGLSGLIYGHMLNYGGVGRVATPSKFLLTGGESLSIKTKNAPQSSIVWTILYRKVSQ